MISPGTPQQRADAVVQRHGDLAGTFQFDPHCKIKEELALPLPQPPLGGAVFGQVTVETCVDVHFPFLLGAITRKRDFQLVASETFPYTYTVPSTLSSTTNGAPSGQTATGQSRQ
jgi:hypothetical protein